MKSIATLSIAAALLCLLASASFPQTGAEEVVTAVRLIDLDQSDLNRIMTGQCPEMAIEFSKDLGLLLPVTLSLQGEVVTLSSESAISPTILQTFYLRCVNEELLFSIDRTHWKPISEALTGIFTVSLNLNDGQPNLNLTAEAHLRT